MLNPEIIAENIIFLRQQHNMTQQELAAQVSVTHQAVSKWENGSSIPDLQTLMTLSRLFEIPLDDLLTEVLFARTTPNPEAHTEECESPATPESAPCEDHTEKTYEERFEDSFEADIERSIEKSIESNITRSIEESINSSIEESFNSAADDVSAADHSQPQGNVPSIDRLIGMAPHMKRSDLRALVMQLDPEKTDLRQLTGLAPFLDHETLDWIATRIVQKNSLSGITGLAPFLSKDTLDKLVSQLDVHTADLNCIVDLAPFLSKDTLDKLVLHTTDLNRITGLAPFLSKDTLDKLVLHTTDLNRITGLAPFLSKDTLDKLVSQLDVLTDDPNCIVGLAPFLSEKTLARFPDLAARQVDITFNGRHSFLKNLFKKPPVSVTVHTTRSHASGDNGDADCLPECIERAIDECDWGYIEDHISALTPEQSERAALAAAEDGFFDFIPSLSLSDDVLSRVAVIGIDQGDIDELIEFLPFERLSDNAQHALFAALIDNDDTDELLAHPVFRQGDYLRQLALHLAESDEFDALERLPLENLDAVTLNTLILMAIDNDNLDWIERRIRYLPARDQSPIAVYWAENEEWGCIARRIDLSVLPDAVLDRLIDLAEEQEKTTALRRLKSVRSGRG